MKTDDEFNTLLIKLIFCKDNISYKKYTKLLKKTKTIKDLIIYTFNKINLHKKIKLKFSDKLFFNISYEDIDVLDLYINIKDLDIKIDQIMIPITLDDIRNQPKWALLFPGNEEIKL